MFKTVNHYKKMLFFCNIFQNNSLKYIVLECPSEVYIDSFVGNERLKELQTSNEGCEPVSIVVHMTPQEVIEHPRYQEFING